MKKYLPSLFFLVLLSCISKTNKVDNKEEKNQETEIPVVREKEFIDSGKFKVAQQSHFSLKEWDWEDMESILTKLNKEEINKYFQAPLDSERIYNTFYFFSIQENAPKRKTITIVEADESCCITLHLLTFDGNNKVVGKSILAGSGGDGEWGYDAYGRFDSDSTYYFTHVEEETKSYDSVGWEAKVDSLVVRFAVDKNLNFKQLPEKKFEYSKVHKSK